LLSFYVRVISHRVLFADSNAEQMCQAVVTASGQSISYGIGACSNY